MYMVSKSYFSSKGTLSNTSDAQKRWAEKLREDEKMDLQDLLEAYQDISCAYVLKEELRALWRYSYGA